MSSRKQPLNLDGVELPPELQSLEAALGALVPRADRLDRDRLLFEAGRQAGLEASGRGGWTWPALTAALTALAAALLVMVVLQPQPQVVERIVYVPVEQPAKPKAEPSAPAERPKRPAASAVANRAKPSPQSPADDGETAAMPYADLRDQVLKDGIDAWPSPTLSLSTSLPAPTAPSTYGQLRDELLKQATSRVWIE